MNITINKLLTNLKVLEPISYKSLTLYPLVNESPGKLKFLSLDSALKKSLIEIMEIDHGGSVPELLLINKSDKKIFLWDGEELIGAKQNRVLNTSLLINAKSENTIPVSCVEQGRWHYNSSTFQKSEFSMPNQIRRSKIKSVDDSLKNDMGFVSYQRKVWDDIEKLSFAAGVKSSTGAMNDVFVDKKDDLDDYIKNLPIQSEQTGFIVAIDGKIIGMEYISRKKVFQKLYQNILRSYATDVIVKYNNLSNKNNIKHPDEFINDLKSAKISKFKSVGLGNEFRMEINGLFATSLVYRSNVIAISAGWDN